MEILPRDPSLRDDAIRDANSEYASSPIAHLLVQINGLKACQKATEAPSGNEEVKRHLTSLIEDRVALLGASVLTLKRYTVPVPTETRRDPFAGEDIE